MNFFTVVMGAITAMIILSTYTRVCKPALLLTSLASYLARFADPVAKIHSVTDLKQVFRRMAFILNFSSACLFQGSD